MSKQVIMSTISAFPQFERRRLREYTEARLLEFLNYAHDWYIDNGQYLTYQERLYYITIYSGIEEEMIRRLPE